MLFYFLILVIYFHSISVFPILMKNIPRPVSSLGDTQSVILNPGEQPPLDPLDFTQDIIESDTEEFPRYRNALKDARGLWKGKIIPYVFGAHLSRGARQAIVEAIEDYDAYTCIRFVPRDPKRHSDYVEFVSDKGCYSYVGRNGGRQTLSLGEGCEAKGIAIHEMMHVVGFMHEQSRSDRDDFVTILYQNIPRKLWDQFDKMKSKQENNLAIKYDYNSVMHYGKKAFTANGRDTIVPKASGVTIGQRRGFSTVDVHKINKLYGCEDKIIHVPGDIIETRSKMIQKTIASLFNITSNTSDLIKLGGLWKLDNGTFGLFNTSACIDSKNNSYCDLKKSIGLCEKSITIAIDHCPVTCGFCKDEKISESKENNFNSTEIKYSQLRNSTNDMPYIR